MIFKNVKQKPFVYKTGGRTVEIKTGETVNVMPEHFKLNRGLFKAMVPVMPSAIDAPVVEAPEVEAPVVEAPVVEAPVVEAPVVEAPVVEAPVEEAPVEEAPVEEAPVEETVKKTRRSRKKTEEK